MANRHLIIASHDSEPLGIRAGNRKLLLVYIEEEHLRPEIHRIDRPYEVILLRENEYDNACFDEQEDTLAKALVLEAIAQFGDGKQKVYLLIPEKMMRLVSDVAHAVSEGHFKVHTSQYQENAQLDATAVFALFMAKIHAVAIWDFTPFNKKSIENFNQHSLGNSLLARIRRPFETLKVKAEEESKEKEFDLNEAYEKLRANPDTIVFEAIKLENLWELFDKCVKDEQEDLVPIVGKAIRENKDFV